MRLRVLLASITVAAAAVAVAAPAASADSGPVLDDTYSVPGDMGTLQVNAHADSDITTVTAHILSEDGGTQIAVTSAFHLVSGTAQNGSWQSDTPLRLPALGYYPVVVDLTDAAGQTSTNGNAGELAYLMLTHLDNLTTNRSFVTYAQRHVVVSGRMMGEDPATRQLRPLAGQGVELTDSDNYAFAVTRANGTFTGTVEVDEATPIGVELNNSAATKPDPYLADDGGAQLPIAIQPSPSRLTEQVSVRRATVGQAVTITGNLSWHSPTGWQPIPDAYLSYGLCADTNPPCSGSDTPVSTDAQGDYTITTDAVQTGYYALTGGSLSDPFIAQVSNNTPDITVR